MQVPYPYQWLSATNQNRAFIVMLPLTILAMFIEQVTGAPLKTDVAPSGIVSFEFAGKLSLAQAMVKSWGQVGQVYAGLNLGFDFVFIITYVICIGLGCVIVARGGFLSSAGIILAWAMFAAGLFDCIENYNLIQILLGLGQESSATIAEWCAIIKFTIVGLGLAYFFIGGVLLLLRKMRATSADKIAGA
ncbi:MAG: hypothetical protein HY868_09905 [Chloroflexi bacterium]|nr:hypothetical protein [Chloroflexota bacterium]